ncbi:MAG: hypothetical protein AAF497_12980 [Planctomycetota bacterium]
MSTNSNPYQSPDDPDPFSRIKEPKLRRTRSCLTMAIIAFLFVFLFLPVTRALSVYYQLRNVDPQDRSESRVPSTEYQVPSTKYQVPNPTLSS